MTQGSKHVPFGQGSQPPHWPIFLPLTLGQVAGCHGVPTYLLPLSSHARTASGPRLRAVCQMYHTPGHRLAGDWGRCPPSFPACLVVPLTSRSVCFPRQLLQAGLQYTGHTMQSPRGARGGREGSLGRRKMRSPEPRLPPDQTLHSDKVWVLPSPSLCIFHWLYRQCPWPSLAVELLLTL